MPKKGKNSRQRRSAEPWEVEYVHRELPVTPREDIETTIETCKDERKEVKTRDELLQCVRKKMA